MKKIQLYIFIIVLGYTSNSLGQSYLNNRFNLGYQDMGHSIIKTDSGFVICSAELEAGGGAHRNIKFIRFDDQLNIVSNRSFGDNFTNYYSFSGCFIPSPTSNNEFLICGSKADTINLSVYGFLMKLDDNGDSLWIKTYISSEDLYFLDVKSTSDGGFILSGITYEFDTDGDALLLKVDSIGNINWQNHYGGALFESANSVTQTIDGGYLFVGKQNNSSTFGDGYVVKTTSTGVLQWSRFYGGNYEDSFECCFQSSIDSSIIISGRLSVYQIMPPIGSSFNKPYLLKMNLQGDTLWTKVYGDSLYSLNIRSCAETNNGGIIACGNMPDSVTLKQSGLVFKTDSDGNLQWFRDYKQFTCQNSNNVLNEVYPTDSDGYLLTGVLYTAPPDTGTQDTWVLALDSLGCDYINCTGVGVNEYQDGDDIISIFPNPSYGETTIMFPRNESNGLLEIFDLRGNKVYFEQIESQNNYISLKNEVLSTGLYFCILTWSNLRKCVKFQVL